MLLAAILFLDFGFEKLRLDGEGGYFPGYLHPTYPSSLLFFLFFYLPTPDHPPGERKSYVFVDRSALPDKSSVTPRERSVGSWIVSYAPSSATVKRVRLISSAGDGERLLRLH